jgi:hypothetical protein
MEVLNRIFSLNPGNFQYIEATLIFGGLLVLSGMIFSFIYNKKHDLPPFKRVFSSTSTGLVVHGLVFLFYSAVRFESITYLSMRLWFYLTILSFAYFIYKTIRRVTVLYPAELKKWEEIQARRNKNTNTKKGKTYSASKKK